MRAISKDALVHSPNLAFQDFENPFTLYTRASGYACGFNRTHVQDNKKISILYEEPNFTDLEKKHLTTEREALSVVVVATEKRILYLFGGAFEVMRATSTT